MEVLNLIHEGQLVVGFYVLEKAGMRQIFLAFMLGLTIVISACSPAKQQLSFNGTDITGADFANSFQLTDHTGKLRKLEDFKGKLVVLFFGYTHCPDVCPTTMMDMANAMKVLGKDSDSVQVVFVTLDPERDTQAVLAKFVPSFDSRFIGLYGTAQQTAAAAQNFKVYYAKVYAAEVKAEPASAEPLSNGQVGNKQVQSTESGDGPGRYTIDHSAGSYVFDKAGKVRIYLKYGQKPAEIASDLKQLL